MLARWGAVVRATLLAPTELQLLVGVAALWVFFSGVNYTRLQFNTGIRYLAPTFPLLFLPAALVVLRLPRRGIEFVALVSLVESWSLAMHRDVERGLGVLDPILHVFIGGFELPALTTLSRMGAQFGEYTARGDSPLPLLALAAAILCGLWAWPAQTRARSLDSGDLTEQ